MSEQIPFPDRLISYWDIAKGVGEVAIELVTKRFVHEGISEHFSHDPLASPVEPVTKLLEAEG